MTQHFLTAAEAGQILPDRPKSWTVWRWMTRGVLCGNKRVRLGYVIGTGRGFRTTPALVQKFLTDQLEALDESKSRPAPRVNRDKTRANTSRDGYKAAMLELAD